MVFIDDAKIEFRGMKMCHLFAIPPDSAELDDIARKVGLRPEWKQAVRWPHYDVSLSYRGLCVFHGAQPVSAREGAALRLRFRKTNGKVGR